MSLLSNLQDKISYKIHQLTFDPAAEEYNASRKAAQEAADAAQRAKDKKEAAELATKTNAAAKEETARQEAEERAAKSEFRTGRFASKVATTIATILFAFALVAGGIYGAHLATNLNLYRSWPYRILYAIYGFIFFPIVLLYVLGYRWWWKGKKPEYYALLPLIPYFINNPLLARLFSWLSYKPDDAIAAFQEWKDDAESA
jgi:hypothetical protein